ncbi:MULTISPECIES: LysR family transcriptional regulator [Rheinheimera]|jgi:DNA-binding transcriptional LysR family regulator|uniref:LysR family transcriptional regulator n=1 Tax=Rheinheimera TaxID=67575 RepID=UPI000E866147|nr:MULTISPECIES: LysR family transcriptional regulator [Rheinheimera]HBN90100.1 LysR family transcriptional regulator [Rheinheimera sp.]|tara:strand:- start:3531 stop:4364 length:834 start_codon:yes stop_codon:yes gene_type:complete
MDIRQLNYFVAVYEQGSVSAAARYCCVAQPSLSAALRQLEQELGVTLFLRLPKGVLPTEDGEKLYGHAGRLLGQLQSLKASFREPVARVKFRLGLIRALGVERMSQLLREFSNSVAGLELHLVEPEEPCDARIITPHQLKAGEAFQPIWRDSYLLAMPPGTALSLQQQIQLTDFEQLPLIKRTPCDAWNILYPELVRLGVKPDIRADIQTIEYALGLVSAGVGCALVPNFDSLLQRQDITLSTITSLNLQREIGLAYPKNQDSVSLTILRQLCKTVG